MEEPEEEKEPEQDLYFHELDLKLRADLIYLLCQSKVGLPEFIAEEAVQAAEIEDQ